MNNKNNMIVNLTVCMLALQGGTLYGASLDAGEYEMKAAYIYNIMQFVQLPEIKRTDDKGEALKIVHVGVSDKDILASVRKVIGDKEITQYKDKYKIQIRYVDVKQLTDKKSQPALDVLFITDTVKIDYRDILKTSIKRNILTFGETKGFLDVGGIVNFVIVKKKLKFEINKGMAEQAGIKFRSQLLKLAQKVVEK